MTSSSRRARGVISLLLAFAVVFGIAGASLPGIARAQEDQKADATLRIVHASPGAPALDVLIDGQPFATNVAFGATTDYAPLPAGDYKLQVVSTGQAADTALIDMDFRAETGKAYIFAVAKPLNEIEGKIFDVNLDAVTDLKARARVINLSPDAGDIDLVVTGGDKLIGGVGFENASDTKDIDPGTLSLDVRSSDDRVLASATGVEILPGRNYDILVVGQVADQSLALVPLVTNVSRPCATVLGLNAGEDVSCVRVVHASPGSPAVDVYINGSPAVQNLAFGTATAFATVPAGDKVKVQVTATGASLDNAVIDSDQELKAGQAYDFLALGPLDSIELRVTQLDITPLPEGQGRIRFTHASPDADKVDVAAAEGSALFQSISYKDTSDYAVVDAGEYTLQVKTGDKQIALQQDVLIESGISYDLFLVGRQDDGSLALLFLTTQASEREGGIATPVTNGEASPVVTVTSSDAPSPDATQDSDSVDTQTETQVAGVPTPTPAT